jgi:small subunit ribosomal protein S17
MAEEDRNETDEQEPGTAEAEAEATAATEAAPEAPAEAPAAAFSPAAPAPAAAPAEVLPPKERKRRARSAKAAKAPARAARTPEERHAERLAERRRKAGLRRIERQRARGAKAVAGPAAASAPRPPVREQAPGVQKTRQGVVVSDRAEKTITVRVDTARRHRRYEKIVRTSRTLHAHDELGDARVGDTVIVRECRPLSRTKRWRLVEVVGRAK